MSKFRDYVRSLEAQPNRLFDHASFDAETESFTHDEATATRELRSAFIGIQATSRDGPAHAAWIRRMGKLITTLTPTAQRLGLLQQWHTVRTWWNGPEYQRVNVWAEVDSTLILLAELIAQPEVAQPGIAQTDAEVTDWTRSGVLAERHDISPDALRYAHRDGRLKHQRKPGKSFEYSASEVARLYPVTERRARLAENGGTVGGIGGKSRKIGNQ
jgi:hypothetical protein